jgi:O-antigen/teichoic acid export membrane protein
MHKFVQKFRQVATNSLVINSTWGGVSQILQGVLLSMYFVLIARNYSTKVFADFLIAMVLYQLLTAFSSLGLSQWFIREITGNSDKDVIIYKFFKLQIYFGLTFYIINITLGFILYDDRQIQLLTIFLGINIVFDNLVAAIKYINISEFKQKKTFIILTIEAFLKFAVTCSLFVFPLSIIALSIILVIIRFCTLNLFLKIGSSSIINLKALLKEYISLEYVKTLLKFNWPFIIIGSVSIINWRISTIIISKILTSKDVADFEISYRIFSIAQMLPVVVSASVFPILVRLFKEGKIYEFNCLYRKIHKYFFLFGLLCFTLIYSFIDIVLPIVFGEAYADAGIYVKQMFFTIIIFPIVILQANVLVAMKLEKLDMLINVVVLMLNLIFCLIGLFFSKSLSVIVISIFLAFVVFQIIQDSILLIKKISSIRHVIMFYILSPALVIAYILLSQIFNSRILFFTFWGVIFIYFMNSNKWGGIRSFSEVYIKS